MEKWHSAPQSRRLTQPEQRSRQPSNKTIATAWEDPLLEATTSRVPPRPPRPNAPRQAQPSATHSAPPHLTWRAGRQVGGSAGWRCSLAPQPSTSQCRSGIGGGRLRLSLSLSLTLSLALTPLTVRREGPENCPASMGEARAEWTWALPL